MASNSNEEKSDFNNIDSIGTTDEDLVYNSGKENSIERMPKSSSLYKHKSNRQLMDFNSEIVSEEHHGKEISDNFSNSDINEVMSSGDQRLLDHIKLVEKNRTVIKSGSKFSKLIEKVSSGLKKQKGNKNSFNSSTSEQDSKSHTIQTLPTDDADSISSITKWWQKYTEIRKQKRKKAAQAEENKMRYKLQYHFMTPFQKYKLGRKPWKLGVQILKIMMVTAQVILFGTDRFASVAFMKNTKSALEYLFIKSFDGSTPFSYFDRNTVVDAIRFANTTYYSLENLSIGKFWYPGFVLNDPPPISICSQRYINQAGNTSLGIDYDAATFTICERSLSDTFLDKIVNQKSFFDSVVSIQLKFDLSVVFLNGLKLRHLPECLQMQNTISIDNSNHDGQLRVTLQMTEDIKNCPERFVLLGEDNTIIQDLLITFDILVILICSLSSLLCVRSLAKSIMLAEAAQKYFSDYKGEELTRWDLLELINKWFAVIVISDLLSIIGSIYKIRVDERDIQFYNICSVLLGLGVVLVWIGMLRFFTYLKTFNILLIALRYAAPNLMRFMFCAMFIFTGFTLCGWIVLGPYHLKFQTFLSTAEGLFSLLNGDDIFATFATMSRLSTSIWIFSKIYLYMFVSLFIYIVLSTFISIVGDTYERLKDWGRMPPTRIEIFMMGRASSGNSNEGFTPTCPRCIREYSLGGRTNLTKGNIEVLSSSRLSIVSASLE